MAGVGQAVLELEVEELALWVRAVVVVAAPYSCFAPSLLFQGAEVEVYNSL